MAVRLFSMRAGMSAEDLARILGVNRKTAQRLLKALRCLVVQLEPTTLPGASEWDEAMVTKQWVGGGVSRRSQQCYLRTIPNRRETTLVPLVEGHSDPNGIVFTDEHAGYLNLANRMSVNHSKEFVNRQAPFVHTNSVEGVWGHLKPFSRHVYRGFPRSSLSQFLSECMFRYNIRNYETRVSVLSALLTRKTNSLLV
jgi:transposase-like protein